MEDADSVRMGFIQRRLPWCIVAVFFVLYFFTRSSWATGASIDTISKITGWSWSPQTNNPLLYLLTYPVRWLPSPSQTLVLNALASLLGALTLGQLARTISLLPQDRTRDQRQRERSDFSLLSLPIAWMPPVFACLICGLQRTFWEESTALSGDILTVFLFSYLLRCLLEFRLNQNDRWLYSFALVYGFALPCDWAFIGYLPLFGIAILWMKGETIFRTKFLFSMLGLGVIGILSYLLLPAIISAQNPEMVSFTQLLEHQFRLQLQDLMLIPKTILLQLSLTSLLPILIMGIRFPTSIGEVSVVGTMLSNFMIRAMHLLFLAACLSVAFDPPFSPRNAGAGFSGFLTFYYLGAIAVGYFAGYALLVFGKSASQRRSKRENRALGMTVSIVLWVAAIASPIALLFQNLPAIRLTNGDRLADFGELLVQKLPDKKALILSDDSFPALLMRASMDRLEMDRDDITVEITALEIPAYERELRKKFLTSYPELLSEESMPQQINPITLLGILAKLSDVGPIYYLNSSFGLYFEVFYPQQHELITKLIPYQEGQIKAPPLPESLILSNQMFWQKMNERLPKLQSGNAGDKATKMIQPWLSKEQNVWAVSLQQKGRLAEAKEGFERALNWNPKNTCAKVNLRQNEVLAGEDRRDNLGLTPQERADVQRYYGTYEELLSNNGPIDEANFRLRLAEEFAFGSNHRQSMLNYLRAVELGATHFEARLKLANSYMLAGFPHELLAEIDRIRAEHLHQDADREAEMIRLEALGHYAVGNQAKAKGDLMQKAKSFELAEALLKNAIENAPENESLLETLSRVYLHTDRIDEALVLLDRHLSTHPDDPRLLQDKALAHMLLEQYPEAIISLSKVLTNDPQNAYAQLNRAIAYYREGNHEKAKADYLAAADNKVVHHAIYFGLGRIAEAAGETDEAMDHFERYLKLAPKESDEYREVSDALSALKKSIEKK